MLGSGLRMVSARALGPLSTLFWGTPPIIVVSSELPEILRVSDRVLVMRRGASEGELSRAQATEESIMRLAVSGAQRQVEAA